MTQQQFEGLIRHALTLVGAIVLVFFSDAEGLVGELTASAIMLASIIWSIATKSGQPVVDKVKGVLNHSVAITGAVLIYFGHDETWGTVESIMGMVMNLIPFIFSFFDKKN